VAGAAFSPWRRGRRVGSLTLKPCAARISTESCFALAGRWAWIFALLVPLQLSGFVWLWADSDSQVNRQINQGERNVAALRSRIGASSSEVELRSLLASANLGPLPPLRGVCALQRAP